MQQPLTSSDFPPESHPTQWLWYIVSIAAEAGVMVYGTPRLVLGAGMGLLMWQGHYGSAGLRTEPLAA